MARKSNDLPKLIGRNIERARQAAGLTQAELAARIGCAQSTVSLWEAGERTPNSIQLPRLAAALDVAAGWFYTDHDADPVAA